MVTIRVDRSGILVRPVAPWQLGVEVQRDVFLRKDMR
jgi:hypothetical protein